MSRSKSSSQMSSRVALGTVATPALVKHRIKHRVLPKTRRLRRVSWRRTHPRITRIEAGTADRQLGHEASHRIANVVVPRTRRMVDAVSAATRGATLKATELRHELGVHACGVGGEPVRGLRLRHLAAGRRTAHPCCPLRSDPEYRVYLAGPRDSRRPNRSRWANIPYC
jgi:hypothetical protein